MIFHALCFTIIVNRMALISFVSPFLSQAISFCLSYWLSCSLHTLSYWKLVMNQCGHLNSCSVVTPGEEPLTAIYIKMYWRVAVHIQTREDIFVSTELAEGRPLQSFCHVHVFLNACHDNIDFEGKYWSKPKRPQCEPFILSSSVIWGSFHNLLPVSCVPFSEPLLFLPSDQELALILCLHCSRCAAVIRRVPLAGKGQPKH